MSAELIFLPIALFAAAGTALRILASGHEQTDRQRAGTLAVNLVGAFLLGVVTNRFNGQELVIIGIGLLGSLTTFSSMIGQIVQAWENDEQRVAVGYLVASVVGGLFAAWVGLQLGDTI